MARLHILLASVLFGTTGTAQALGPVGTSPATVGAGRVAVGGLLLVLAARLARRAPWHAATLAGGVAVATYQLCFFAAVDQTGVALGTVVALGSAPVLAGLLARAVSGEPLTASWALATALAAAGVAALALGPGEGTQASMTGIALALGAGASYAAMTVASKRQLTAGLPGDVVMARTFGTGALLLAPVLLLGGGGWVLTPGGAALVLFLGAVPTAAAYLLFARGLQSVPPGEAATLTLAEPVTATILGVLVLGEAITPAAGVGALLVLAGLAVLIAPARGRPLRPVPAPA